jgi:hypothetical protein
METRNKTLRQTRIILWTFIVFLALSGITAFPLETEMKFLVDNPQLYPSSFIPWLTQTYEAIHQTNITYPFMAYGTDWLAFAHLVLAVVFIGAIKDPARNIWVIQFGMIACVMVFPLALIAGAVRNIPFYWRLIDCSFGVIGLIPLTIAYRNTKTLLKTDNRWQ